MWFSDQFPVFFKILSFLVNESGKVILDFLPNALRISDLEIPDFFCFCFVEFSPNLWFFFSISESLPSSVSMEFTISDDLLGTFVPIFVYWFYSGIYLLLGFFENYRLHSKNDEDEKNLVSKSTVVRGVLFQQTIQAIVAIILFKVSFFFCWISSTVLQFIIVVIIGI